ncbi:MAG: radical SAM protein [Thermodesulfobacteriota bacterium]
MTRRAAYLDLTYQELEERIQEGLKRLKSCTMCPRRCAVDRLGGEIGFCQTGRLSRLASFHLHFGEESPLVGEDGSGTIFFAGCNLGCLFCQNFDISHRAKDSPEVLPDQLAEAMLELQRKGALNINLVSPSHVVPQILEALVLAAASGLCLPIVYNCGGYEEIQTLRLLEGIIDIYMPDLKFADPANAKKYCLAEDYTEKARLAVKEMQRQVGDLELDSAGIAKRGLMIRHLLMPSGLAGSAEWFEFLSSEISRNTYLNIMDQYHPCGQARRYPELDRTVSRAECEEAVKLAKDYGLARLDRRDQRRLRHLFRLL